MPNQNASYQMFFYCSAALYVFYALSAKMTHMLAFHCALYTVPSIYDDYKLEHEIVPVWQYLRNKIKTANISLRTSFPKY